MVCVDVGDLCVRVMVIVVSVSTDSDGPPGIHAGVFSLSSLCPLQVELHVHLDGSIKPETILYYGR